MKKIIAFIVAYLTFPAVIVLLTMFSPINPAISLFLTVGFITVLYFYEKKFLPKEKTVVDKLREKF